MFRLLFNTLLARLKRPPAQVAITLSETPITESVRVMMSPAAGDRLSTSFHEDMPQPEAMQNALLSLDHSRMRPS